MNTISERAKFIKQKIDEVSSNGSFFSVQFTKVDGTIRDMNCRTGVTKHLKGGQRTVPEDYIVVYDVKSNGYRTIRPEAVLKINGISV